MFFTLSSWQLAFVLAGIIFGATVVGLVAGRSLSRHAETLREPLGIVQGALLTLVGLILAFGLAMAVGRYDARRTAVVNDANTIGTAYLRAQTLREPVRSESLPLYAQYADASIRLSNAVPGSAAAKSAIADESALQRRLWGLAGRALANDPKVLLADEPTGALDSTTGAQIVELLLRLRDERGMTIVLVTNDDAIAGAADRTLRIRDGRVEDGAGATPAAAPRSAAG